MYVHTCILHKYSRGLGLFTVTFTATVVNHNNSLDFCYANNNHTCMYKFTNKINTRIWKKIEYSNVI